MLTCSKSALNLENLRPLTAQCYYDLVGNIETQLNLLT
jgi:hypothetical protein